jgi:hypothetical protein
MVGQQGNVFAPLPQGGQEDGEDLEAIVEVFTEKTFAHLGIEVLVGGRYDANVDFALGGFAHPLDFPLLQTRSSLTWM